MSKRWLRALVCLLLALVIPSGCAKPDTGAQYMPTDDPQLPTSSETATPDPLGTTDAAPNGTRQSGAAVSWSVTLTTYDEAVTGEYLAVSVLDGLARQSLSTKVDLGNTGVLHATAWFVGQLQ